MRTLKVYIAKTRYLHLGHLTINESTTIHYSTHS